MMTSQQPERALPLNPFRVHLNSLEQAGRALEKFLSGDSNFPRLTQLMHLSQQCMQSHSGMIDQNYPGMNHIAPGLPGIKELTTVNRIPLPPEVIEHFARMQCNCMMGLFTEIHRAWLTIDSDIYVWSYEHGTDLAYFDGLGEAIISVGLVKPKPNIFYQFIKYLLVLTTTAEIVVLGVKFTSSKPDGPLGALEEMHLLPEPIFVIPTDKATISTVASCCNGRIFLGGHDGCLYEIDYKVERTWFGKRFVKRNHSTGYLSYLVPSFITSLTYGEEDPVMQIAIDNSRHILYTLTERGTIEVWDLGESGLEISRVTSVQQNHIVSSACNIVKTVDAKNFRPIINISVLEISDSRHLNLVAVAQTGVRFYFGTSMSGQLTARPTMLLLHHVRMPPGFAANSPAYRPANANTCLYSKGNLVLVTSPGGEQDALWCLSSDLFPFLQYIKEIQTIVPLDGKVWAVAEVQNNAVEFKNKQQAHDEDPPLVVRQHMEPPKKYVVLTAQGAQILLKYRPVDILRQILVESRGCDSEALKNFFLVQSEEQACATCLILACLESQQNIQISEWATRAFFLYGGEPKSVLVGGTVPPVVAPALPQPTGTTPHHYAFNPAVASTPTSVGSSPIQDPSSFIQNSTKHNGLFIYLGRILRPIWYERVVARVTMQNKQQFLSSTVTSEECVWILGHLHSVKSFLEKNSQFSTQTLNTPLISTNTKRDSFQSPVATGTSSTARPVGQRNYQMEANVEEKNSLLALKTLINHSCEVLGLWKILCEHQFHIIADMLDKDVQNHLPNVLFRELILGGHNLCSLFINSLINSYLGDNASVDSISSKLRDVCPTLYKNEDAACSKANEMLISAKKNVHVDEKEAKLRAALDLCKDVATQIDLAQICQQFAANQFYLGILELCITCANKYDPKNIALHWYKNKEPQEDMQGYDAYMKRMDCYKQVTLVLDQLYNCSRSAPSIPVSPGTMYDSTNGPISPQEAEVQTKQLLELALDSNDELFHIAVYEWMMVKELHGELISITNTSLENYLTRSADNQTQVCDLLWKYYEKNQNHASAAKVLHKLAVRKGQGLTLSQRIGYLARAVMCMRSDKVGSAPHLGVFLQELEDKMEVAAIQQMVLDSVANLRNNQNSVVIDEAVSRLNNELFTCTVLYEDFAEPFKLWECKLAIVHSTNHNDPMLVEDIWQNIIESELKIQSTKNVHERLAGLLIKIKVLTQEYEQSLRCYPLLFILRTLETLSCRFTSDISQVFTCLLTAGVNYIKLLQAYHMLRCSEDHTWAMEGNEFHIVETVSELCSYFADSPQIVSGIERREAVSKSQDTISLCLIALYAKPNSANLIARLRAVESKLKRMEGL